MGRPPETEREEALVRIAVGAVTLEGDLNLPHRARAVVLFAHGSGSSRFSPRNRQVARVLNDAKLATLLVDLLTAEEEAVDLGTAQLRFDIELLAERLVGVTEWLTRDPHTRGLSVGYFGASTGAAAALVAAAEFPDVVRAVVSRGGRPDLAGRALERVRAPTLLIVGGNDVAVLELNRAAFLRLRCEKRLAIVPGASHLFEEPGALDQVALMAREWFERHLVPLVQPANTTRKKGDGAMIIPFVDTSTGTPVFINPEYVVTLRPDPMDPDHVSLMRLRDGESLRVKGEPREVAEKLLRAD